MGYIVGGALGLVICAFARTVGFDRDRAFYPTVLIVVASYYVLFAVMGGSTQALALELVVASPFVVMAVASFKRNLWLAVAGLAAHGVMDFFHAQIVENVGVPAWWPAFCGTIDIALPACVALLAATGHGLPNHSTASGNRVE